jgi:YVTN family beta-propeller protein
MEGATDSVIATVTAGHGPYAICYNPQNDKVYCANALSNNVTVIDGATNLAIRTIAVGGFPMAFAHNPIKNRMYVSNRDSSTISVLRDSGGGIEESPKPQAPSFKPAATVVRGLPAGAIAFDAMGRRVTNPGPGVYFVREQSAFSSQYSGRSAAGGERSAVSVRKVVLQR